MGIHKAFCAANYKIQMHSQKILCDGKDIMMNIAPRHTNQSRFFQIRAELNNLAKLALYLPTIAKLKKDKMFGS